MNKKAFKSSLGQEYIASSLYGMTPYVNSVNVLGALSGDLASPYPNRRNGILNLLPGVGAHRITNRLKTQAMEEYRKHGIDGLGQLKAEQLGPYVSTLLTTGLGAGTGALAGSAIGKMLGKQNGGKYGAIGGAIGGGSAAIVANIATSIIAAVKRRRTEKEQLEHDADRANILASLLLPGTGRYNILKRLGRSEGDIEEQEAKKKSNR